MKTMNATIKRDLENELDDMEKAIEAWKSANRVDAHIFIKIFEERRKVILAKLEN